jgi:hypothetical protein
MSERLTSQHVAHVEQLAQHLARGQFNLISTGAPLYHEALTALLSRIEELERDKERLDWVQRHAPRIEYLMHLAVIGACEWHVSAPSIGGDRHYGKSANIREAIDSATRTTEREG